MINPFRCHFLYCITNCIRICFHWDGWDLDIKNGFEIQTLTRRNKDPELFLASTSLPSCGYLSKHYSEGFLVGKKKLSVFLIQSGIYLWFQCVENPHQYLEWSLKVEQNQKQTTLYMEKKIRNVYNFLVSWDKRIFSHKAFVCHFIR